MASTDQEEYILGTDEAELYRLGLQHQVWASESQQGWKTAQFSTGDTILDLGSGPGYCTKELAFITGPTGKVIAVDRSRPYLEFLASIAEQHGLHVDVIQSDVQEFHLPDESLDGMYSRWALAWLDKPKETLSAIYQALKPGGRMVIHEYYDWSTHQTEPEMPGLKKAIRAALKSFKESEGEIDIGREVPAMLTSLGMEILSVRLISKLATPADLTWQWPKSFYYSYFPRLVEMGHLTEIEKQEALNDLQILEHTPGATLCCPLMMEIIAEKL